MLHDEGVGELAGGHSWAGTTLAGRREIRSRAILDAGLELLGTQGSAAVSVRSVCREARLTDRYFYENFADRDALLLAVYDEVAGQAEQALMAAVAALGGVDPHDVARAAVGAFLDVLTQDPRKGRVLLLEPLTDPVLGTRSVAVSPVFVTLIRAQLPEDDGSSTGAAALTATALVGAMANLFIRWLDGSLPVSRAVLTDYCVRLLVTSIGIGSDGLSPPCCDGDVRTE